MSIRRTYEPDTFRPAPGASPGARRTLAQCRHDVLSTMRNGEQLLLTLIIPIVLLVALTGFDIGGEPGTATINTVVPSILALAVMSTAFTSLAISTGFDRRSGALKLLSTTPLTRTQLLVARVLAVLVIEVGQFILIGIVGALLGWRPSGGGVAAAIGLLLLGTVCFGAWGMVVAGVLRAEATLAVANGIYLLLLLGGGVAVPQSQLPGAWATIVSLLPSGALAGGLRIVMAGAPGSALAAAAVLAVWTVVGALIAGRTFRWE